MKKLFLYMLPVFFLAACTTENSNNSTVDTDTPQTSKDATFQIGIEESTALVHGNLQVYPIMAKEDFYKSNEAAATVGNLKEGIDTKGFYVTEKKPYGRQDDMSAVNSLTVQNKSDKDIYLMQGDVVTGGNQDRIIAEDQIIVARSIQDVPVFCVEKSRWHYREHEVDENDPESTHKRKIFAFSGYYNVAANDLRRTVRTTQDQSSVWTKVGEFTAKNNAPSETHTYAALEGSESFTTQRDSYMNFFKGKLESMENCVGFVAVSGNEIIGVDLFGHPNLFQKQADGLLNGYVADAITTGSPVTVSVKRMVKYQDELNSKYKLDQKHDNQEDLFQHNGVVIHYSKL